MESNVADQEKRSRKRDHIHRCQEFDDLFENDRPPTDPVNTSLVSAASVEDLYDNMGQNYENLEDKFTPFVQLVPEVKEEFIKRMRGIEPLLKKRNCIPQGSEASIDSLPIKVPDTHRHNYVSAPKHPLLEETSVYMNIDEEEDNVTYLLDNAFENELNKLYKFDAWENFIRPILFHIESDDTQYDTTVGLFLDTMFNKNRLEWISFEIKKFGSKHKILISLRLDERDIFFVCVIFETLDKTTQLTKIPISSDLQHIDKTQKESFDLIKNYRVRFDSYFYFLCNCDK